MEFYLPNMRDTVDTTVPGLADNFNKVARLFTPGDPEAHTHDGVNSEKISHNNLKDLTAGDPHPQYILKTQRGAPNGVATLDSTGKVPTSQLPALNFIPNSMLSAPNGVATLDANGKLVQDAKTVGGYAPSTSATAGTIPVRDGNGRVPGSITGDAATVGGRSPGLSAGNLAYYDANGRVVDSNKVGGRSPGTAPGNLAYYDTNGRVADSAKVGGMAPGTTAGTIAYYDASGRVADSNRLAGHLVGTGANQIPVRDSAGKVPGSITGDAATVGGKAPGTSAGNIAFYDTSGRVVDSNKLAGMSPSTGATANTIAQRDASGRIQVATPSAANDAANKTYVDTNFLGKTAKAADSDKVDGIHLRNNSGSLEWSTNGSTWNGTGMTQDQIVQLILVYA